MGDNDRFAILIRTPNYLELQLFDRKRDLDRLFSIENNKELKDIMVSPGNGVIGIISFFDSRQPPDILVDFSEIYLGSKGVFSSSVVPARMEYPPLYEPTIAPAFVNYFSERVRQSQSP
jgi:hypothetical protein